MKTNLIAVTAIMAFVSHVMGHPQLPFTSWDDVKRHSTDIFIARCVKTVDDPRPILAGRGLIDSEMVIVSVLTAQPNPGKLHLLSEYWPRQGENYLIFSNYKDGKHYAIERYRITPLGTYIPPDFSNGKTLNEQLQSAFKYRLFTLEQEIKDAQEEKQHLESGIKK